MDQTPSTLRFRRVKAHCCIVNEIKEQKLLHNEGRHAPAKQIELGDELTVATFTYAWLAIIWL